MANTPSQLMLNAIATNQWSPSVVGESHGRSRYKICRFSTLAADAASHLYRLCLLKAHDRVISIRRINSADAGMTAVDIGAWTPTGTSADPTVALDADCLALDAALQAAQLTPAEILGTGIPTMAANCGKMLWEVAGVAASPPPGTEYEIIAQPGGNPAGGGDYTIIIEYVAATD